jgi:hypothetical protein
MMPGCGSMRIILEPISKLPTAKHADDARQRERAGHDVVGPSLHDHFLLRRWIVLITSPAWRWLVGGS